MSLGAWIFAIVCLAFSVAGVAPAAGQAVADFYRGKNLTLLIGSGEGGGFDASARLAAQFLPKFLPGAPAITLQYMPGASGLRSAEHLFNIAPRDGSVFGITQPQLVLNKALDPKWRFVPQKFNWLGRMGSFTTFIVVRTDSPVQTLAALKTRKFIVAGSAPTGPGVMAPTALNRLIGTKFSIVSGYKSAQDSGLALERGEVEGIGSAAYEFVASKGWLQSGFARMMFTIGQTRSPRFPDTPTVVELVDDARDVKAMKLIVVGASIGRAFLAPPDTPSERVEALRTAFDQMLRDPGFLAESARFGFDVEPMRGEDLQKLVAEATSIGEDVAARARQATTLEEAR